MTEFAQHHCGASCTDVVIAAANSAKESAAKAEAAAETAAKDAVAAIDEKVADLVQQQLENAVDDTYLKKTEAADTYLTINNAAAEYATKDELTSRVNDINAELDSKLNAFSTTKTAFDQMQAQGQLQDRSIYVVSDNS